MKVLGTSPRSNGGMVRIMLDDGGIEEAWTPNLEPVKAWGENPIPPNWELKDRRDGKGKILVDRDEKRAGGGGYRQSKEAFDREAESRLAWQREEEDRKDRRTAAMTAFEWLPVVDDVGVEEQARVALLVADRIYVWLNRSPAAGPAPSGAGVATTDKARAESNTEHGAPAAPVGQAGDPRPGEAGASTPSPGFTIKPKDCTHRAGGDWAPTVTIGGQSRCSLCGTPAIRYRETA